MTTLLITGASGFIGRNLSEQLKRHYDVTAPPQDRPCTC
ncbi:MAG: NAD-dependent epimerase/dehydratase family protein [Betaproteobacteria bacterium]|nr:NAD-dependent epimerase/dehydratase family protein [Betaproteobacteria bacterium]